MQASGTPEAAAASEEEEEEEEGVARAAASDSGVTFGTGKPSAARRAALMSSRAYSAGQIPDSAHPPTPSAIPVNFIFVVFVLREFFFFLRQK